MNNNRSERIRAVRRRLAITLLVVFCLISGGRVLFKQWQRYQTEIRPDPITKSDQRFDKLRTQLPPHGVVGYIGAAGTNLEYDLNSFFVTQYSLSPVVLNRIGEHALVVGNMDPAGPQQISPFSPELQLIENFGDGVMLFRRVAK